MAAELSVGAHAGPLAAVAVCPEGHPSCPAWPHPAPPPRRRLLVQPLLPRRRVQQLPRRLLGLRLLPGGLPGQRHTLRGPGRGGCPAGGAGWGGEEAVGRRGLTSAPPAVRRGHRRLLLDQQVAPLRQHPARVPLPALPASLQGEPALRRRAGGGQDGEAGEPLEGGRRRRAAGGRAPSAGTSGRVGAELSPGTGRESTAPTPGPRAEGP